MKIDITELTWKIPTRHIDAIDSSVTDFSFLINYLASNNVKLDDMAIKVKLNSYIGLPHVLCFGYSLVNPNK